MWRGLAGTQYRVTPAQIEQAIERTGDKYVTDMTRMFDEVGRLYQGQLAAKDETISELRRRTEAAESRVSALEERQANHTHSHPAPRRRPQTQRQTCRGGSSGGGRN